MLIRPIFNMATSSSISNQARARGRTSLGIPISHFRFLGLVAVMAILCSPSARPQETLNRTRPMMEEIESLMSGIGSEMQRAMNSLRRSGQAAIPPLLEVLASPRSFDEKLRLGSALETLLSDPAYRTPETLARLRALTTSNSYSDVSPVIGCISAYKDDPLAMALLRELAGAHPNEGIRTNAIGALIHRLPREEANLQLFRKLLREDDSLDVKIAAARGLATAGDLSGKGLILDVLERPSIDIRTQKQQMEAAIVAGRLGTVDLLPVLQRLLNNPKAYMVARDASAALFQIRLKNAQGEAEALLILKEALRNRLASEWAARRLTDMGTAAAREILQDAADDDTHPGQRAARAHLK